MKQIKVALADDHHLVRHGVKLMVDRFSRFEVVCEASNGKELIENMLQLESLPDIALIDLSMPVMNGLETIQYIVKHHPQVKCIALSVSNDFETVFKIINAGAKGFLPKDTTPDIMERSMTEVYFSITSYDDFVITKLREYRNKGENIEIKNNNYKLSKREIEFIQLSCSEMPYKQVAEAMNIGISTMQTYRERVFKKLGVNNRNGILLFAVNAGLYKPEL